MQENTSRCTIFTGERITYSESRALGRQEGRRGRRLLLQRPVPAYLFGLLSDDRAEEVHERQLVASVLRPDGLRLWQDAEDDVGEGLGERDGAVEVADGEIVLAGQDLGLVGAGEDAVGAEGVELLLLEGRHDQIKRPRLQRLLVGEGGGTNGCLR